MPETQADASAQSYTSLGMQPRIFLKIHSDITIKGCEEYSLNKLLRSVCSDVINLNHERKLSKKLQSLD